MKHVVLRLAREADKTYYQFTAQPISEEEAAHLVESVLQNYKGIEAKAVDPAEVKQQTFQETYQEQEP